MPLIEQYMVPAANSVDSGLDGTISVDIFSCVCVSIPISISECKVMNQLMLIYTPRTPCSLYDWTESQTERPIFFWMCPPTGLYLLFVTLVKHPSLALRKKKKKTLHSTPGVIFYQGSQQLKIHIRISISNFSSSSLCFVMFSLSGGSECDDLNF